MESNVGVCAVDRHCSKKHLLDSGLSMSQLLSGRPEQMANESS
jgi:hypothetical protein